MNGSSNTRICLETGAKCHNRCLGDCVLTGQSVRNYINPIIHYDNPPKKGWVCPKCDKALAPWMPSCDCYKNSNNDKS